MDGRQFTTIGSLTLYLCRSYKAPKSVELSKCGITGSHIHIILVVVYAASFMYAHLQLGCRRSINEESSTRNMLTEYLIVAAHRDLFAQCVR